MSHFTHIKTRFQNIFYLEKALNRLDIVHKPKLSDRNLVIPQSNDYDIEFRWNGEEYELTVDADFWNQDSSMDNYIDKVGQEYAGEVAIGESKKIGFRPVKYQQNSDGSKTLVLERWNSGKS